MAGRSPWSAGRRPNSGNTTPPHWTPWSETRSSSAPWWRRRSGTPRSVRCCSTSTAWT
ncbi:hypothetical protein ACFFX0_16460 [Citricoccus parietis]|uniref:Uncharacterized protein n=1 Tax=Citricoccus parietis TaxID=592307 RepID=A0ABV5G2K5_9MICC